LLETLRPNSICSAIVLERPTMLSCARRYIRHRVRTITTYFITPLLFENL
jgi:hypothetical protein